jgi:hypothetical protein
VEPIIGQILTLVGATAAALLTFRVSTRKIRADSENSKIDQHQEDNAELRKENAALRRQVRVQGDYIGRLRRHIADEQPPPPPPWPDSLIT